MQGNRSPAPEPKTAEPSPPRPYLPHLLIHRTQEVASSNLASSTHKGLLTRAFRLLGGNRRALVPGFFPGRRASIDCGRHCPNPPTRMAAATRAACSLGDPTAPWLRSRSRPRDSPLARRSSEVRVVRSLLARRALRWGACVQECPLTRSSGNRVAPLRA
jgi:hypothetical protein